MNDRTWMKALAERMAAADAMATRTPGPVILRRGGRLPADHDRIKVGPAAGSTSDPHG